MVASDISGRTDGQDPALPCPELPTNVACKQVDGHHLAGTLTYLTLIANTAAKNSYGAPAKPLSFVFLLQEIKALVVRNI